MTWPQIVMLICVLGTVVWRPFAFYHAYPHWSSGAVTAATFAAWTVDAFFVYVLHAGGFW